MKQEVLIRKGLEGGHRVPNQMRYQAAPRSVYQFYQGLNLGFKSCAFVLGTLYGTFKIAKPSNHRVSITHRDLNASLFMQVGQKYYLGLDCLSYTRRAA